MKQGSQWFTTFSELVIAIAAIVEAIKVVITQ